LALVEFSGGFASRCCLLQFRSHCVTLPRHVQLDEYIKRGSQLFSLRLGITLFAREKAPSPVAVSQAAPVAQLQAERFLFLVQLKSLLQPAPGLQEEKTRNGQYSVNGILSDIPSSGIFRVVGGDLAQSLCFISENSEY
jgi:hypothetical protein